MQFPKQGILELSVRRVRKIYRSRWRQSAPSPFNTPLLQPPWLLQPPTHTNLPMRSIVEVKTKRQICEILSKEISWSITPR